MNDDLSPNVVNLAGYLADKFPMTERAYFYGTRAGVKMGHVLASNRPVEMWLNLIDEAMPSHQNKMARLLKELLADYPDDVVLRAANAGELTDIASKVRMEDTIWLGEPLSKHEKLLGEKSTLLPISFLEEGLTASQSVAKVIVRQPNKSWSGTGFLVDENLFLTNHHVLPNREAVVSSEFLFNYRVSQNGNPALAVIEKAENNCMFYTSKEHDCTAIKMSSGINERWGSLKLAGQIPAKWSSANIVQHPLGRPKEIGLYRNYVVFSDEERLQYLTDTEPGSSGAPVFDSQWNVVAIHHSGGWIVEPGTSLHSYRNEGVASSRILKLLESWGLR